MRNARKRVRLQHAFPQIVEDQHARRASELAEGGLVHLRPGACAGTEDDQPDAFAAEAERQHKQACASIAARLRVADQRSFAVVHLRFFAGLGDDDGTGLRRRRSAELVDETLDALIAPYEAVIVHQVLPDGFSVAAFCQPLLDQFPIGFAGARGCGLLRWAGAGVGDHLVGRF